MELEMFLVKQLEVNFFNISTFKNGLAIPLSNGVMA